MTRCFISRKPGCRSGWWRRPVPAIARPDGEERNLSAHGAPARGRDRRSDSRKCQGKERNEVLCVACLRPRSAMAQTPPPAQPSQEQQDLQAAERRRSQRRRPDAGTRSAPQEISECAATQRKSNEPWRKPPSIPRTSAAPFNTANACCPRSRRYAGARPRVAAPTHARRQGERGKSVARTAKHLQETRRRAARRNRNRRRERRVTSATGHRPRAALSIPREIGAMGDFDEARRSWRRDRLSIYPCAESARELGQRARLLGFNEQAAMHFADAFMIPDSAPSTRTAPRTAKRLGEVYCKTHKSEKGMGDLILEAYDRTAALIERAKRLNDLDPNASVTDPMDFTITGLDGEKAPAGSLKGKVVILRFLGHLVRAVPHSASYVRPGEEAFQGSRRRGVPLHRCR